jgi:exopolysaccharide biosynthesis protein
MELKEINNMKNQLYILVLLLASLLGAPAGRLAAQGVAPSKQATDPDDRTPAEKIGTSAGHDGAPAGQWHWTAADAAYGPLPPSMHVYRTEDSLEGRPSIAYYVSVPLKDKSLEFTDQVGYGQRFTPAQYYQQEQNPLLVINTSFFSFKTNANLDLVVKDGKMVAWNETAQRRKGKDSLTWHYTTRGALGISRKRKADIAWIFTDSTQTQPYAFEDGPVTAEGLNPDPTIKGMHNSHWQHWKMQTAVGGGPVLIHNGIIQVTNQAEGLFIKGDRDLNPRSAIGYTRDGRLIILAVQGRTPKQAAGVTLSQEAKILLDLGCYEALNLDGGGSSCLLVNGKETIRPSDKEGERPVPSVFLIKLITK